MERVVLFFLISPRLIYHLKAMERGERLEDLNLLMDNFTIGKIIEKIYYVFVRFVIIATFGIVRENGFRNGENVNVFFVVNCLRIRFIYIYFFLFLFSVRCYSTVTLMG